MVILLLVVIAVGVLLLSDIGRAILSGLFLLTVYLVVIVVGLGLFVAIGFGGLWLLIQVFKQ